MYIGIDFSITSPGICIYDEKTDLYKYISIFRKHPVKKQINIITELQKIENVFVKVLKPRVIKTDNISSKEIFNTLDAIDFCEYIIKVIKYFNPVSVKIAIEGFSFSSLSLSLSEISGYQYILRYLLFKEFSLTENELYIFSPSTIKKYAGKGNYTKREMFNAVLDKYTDKTDFLKYCRMNSDIITQGKNDIVSPIGDMIDAFFITELLKTKFS